MEGIARNFNLVPDIVNDYIIILAFSSTSAMQAMSCHAIFKPYLSLILNIFLLFHISLIRLTIFKKVITESILK